MKNNTMDNKNFIRDIIRVALATVLILLIPLVGRWPWTVSDFVTMGILIFGTGFAYILATRKVRDVNKRLIIGAVLAMALFLVWAELAVGIFGSPIAGS